jgi:hypothetical protein
MVAGKACDEFDAKLVLYVLPYFELSLTKRRLLPARGTAAAGGCVAVVVQYVE